METSHFPSPTRGRERYRASGHEAACAGNTRLFARAEAARVTAMLLLIASGSKGPLVPLADSLRIPAARSAAKRHPAVFPLLLTRPAATPAARTARDSVQEALREAGLAADEAARATGSSAPAVSTSSTRRWHPGWRRRATSSSTARSWADPAPRRAWKRSAPGPVRYRSPTAVLPHGARATPQQPAPGEELPRK